MPQPTAPGTEPIRLTSLSPAAGCGCKIAPSELEKILHGQEAIIPDPRLLVGYGSRDDAAVYDLGGDRCLISTTDFFAPIVDDPFDFGRIAATNALSDVYAMGGTPLLAVAILGWPIEKLGAEPARMVVEGGRRACHDAGIVLAGGHSIDAPVPFFGLAVTGEVNRACLKRNDTARAGDRLYLTKPLGIGILSTALKRGQLPESEKMIGRDLMAGLNSVGIALGKLDTVHALTDVTGFGLLGHLLEVCRGSGLNAALRYDAVPKIPEALRCLAGGHYPDGALRNWKSYAHEVSGASTMERMLLLSDPQTSGGLLIACAPEGAADLERTLRDAGIEAGPIGQLHARDAQVQGARVVVE